MKKFNIFNFTLRGFEEEEKKTREHARDLSPIEAQFIAFNARGAKQEINDHIDAGKKPPAMILWIEYFLVQMLGDYTEAREVAQKSTRRSRKNDK